MKFVIAQRNGKGQFVKGSSGFNGRHSETTRAKIRAKRALQTNVTPIKNFQYLSVIANRGKKRTPEQCARISEGHKGIKYPQSHRDNHRLRFTGVNNPRWKGGKHHCVDCGIVVSGYVAKRCRKCMGLKERGEHHPNWRGGISSKKRSTSHPEYKQWRSDVFQRDNWTCQTCGKRGDGIRLEGHHIKSWAMYPELRYEIDNGVTLCHECHELTDNYRGRA
jgi:5-methylcytosine-specific restriction endonuclease McrA